MKQIIKSIILSLLAIFPITVYAESGIEKFYINAVVEENGDLTVEEYFYLNGEFNGMEREILYQNDDLYDFHPELDYYGGSKLHNGSGIELIEIRALPIDENFDFKNISGSKFEEVSSADKGDYGVYTVDTSSNGEVYQIYLPDKKNEAFYIKYRLKNMAIIHNDIAEIYWNAIGDSLSESIGTLRITVTFPGNENEFRVWAHGPLYGDVKMTEDGAHIHLDELDSGEVVDVRILFDTSLITDTSDIKRSNENSFERIIGIEAERKEAADALEAELLRKYNFVVISSIIMGVAVISLTIFVYFKYGKSPKSSYYSKYNREFIDDYGVEVIDYLMKRKITPNALSAAIMNLIYKKNISVKEIVSEKKKVKDYEFTLEDMTNLSGNDILLVNFLFDTVGKGKVNDIDIHMIYIAKAERMGQTSGSVKAIEAFRKVDLVVVQDLYLTSSAKFADIVLPITSLWEREGNLAPGYRDTLLWTSKVIEPLFEAKDDIWVARELGAKLGLDTAKIQPYSPKQDIFNQVAKATVIDEETNEYKPLVTITENDIKNLGVNGKPQQGVIDLEEFKEKGIYHYPRKKGTFNHIVMEDFIKDPVKNPLPSESGKFEIYCKKLQNLVNNIGFSEIRAIPAYNRPVEGYEDCFENWEKKVPGKYPLQLLSLHVHRRAHSNFENTPWLREAFDHQILINPVDAEARGLKNNDTVLISSRHGRVLRRINITETIRPGVIGFGQGGWIKWDDELKLDRGGCINILVGAYPTGQGHFGFNTCNVQVEKWTGEQLPMEKDIPLDVPVFSEGGNK